MPTYSVSLGYVLNGQIEVKARNEDDAREKAIEEFMGENPEFSQTDAEIVVDFVEKI